jgi:hypothetical protein
MTNLKPHIIKGLVMLSVIGLTACGQSSNPSDPTPSVIMQAPSLPAPFEIDFEGLPTGTIVDEVSEGAGISGTLDGTVGVFGYNPNFGLGTNAAVVFDSSNPHNGGPGDDYDLGSPNETCNPAGPGVGTAGEVGSPYENCDPLGQILEIDIALTDSDHDGLVDDPDDADNQGEYFHFDFSKSGKGKDHGTVTIDSVTLLDIEADENEGNTNIIMEGPDIGTQFISIPPSGNNGKKTISGINQEGVESLTIQMNGSGALASVGANTGEPGLCWLTTGGFHNAGTQSGGKDFTFGGNVGPPAAGSWEVIDHNTGDNFHSNDVHITDCLVIENTGPGQPGGKKGFEINKAEFEGTGRLNGVDGYPFKGYVVDSGEPQGKKNNDPDQFYIIVYEPGHFEDPLYVAFETQFDLDGGNVQIHPPTGSS